MTQAKDFLALSHGQEWVSFYESFDKLVQDNLSRSSELLRRAMALPEVADREVQQIRTEMDQKLSEERKRQRDLLTSMGEDLASTYRQVSMLARSVGTVIGDLDRLTQRLQDAVATFDFEAHASAPAEVQEAPAAPVSNGFAAMPAAPSYVVPEPAAPEAPTAEMDAVAAAEPVLAEAADSVEDLAAAMQEQQELLDAVEQQLDNAEAGIDLSALAEAEAVPTEESAVAEAEAEEPAAETEPVAVGVVEAEPLAESRPRPHWLSVTRNGSR
jgi:hypothetical protein